jgi:succinyl-CoA--D-citramalate CoA-transferase
MTSSPDRPRRPLDDIRVLELGAFLAGPFCGQLLADFGADVIKVEPPGKGDPMREWGRQRHNGRSLWWPILARNKRSVTIDLRTAAGQELVRRLVPLCDIVVENFRPGTLEEWGLGWETLNALNPRLIMVRVSGFGQTGPYRDKAGFGSIGEAMGGIRAVTGFPDRPPARIGISIGDSLAAVFATVGALTALHERQRSGRGQVVDIGIYEGVLAVMESMLPEYQLTGHIRERTGTILPNVAPSNIYPTKEGLWFAIGANADAVFRRLTEAMGQPELATDPRYATHSARGNHQAELDELIAAWTIQHTTDELQQLVNGCAWRTCQSYLHRTRNVIRSALRCAPGDHQRSGARHWRHGDAECNSSLERNSRWRGLDRSRTRRAYRGCAGRVAWPVIC